MQIKVKDTRMHKYSVKENDKAGHYSGYNYEVPVADAQLILVETKEPGPMGNYLKPILISPTEKINLEN